MMKPMIDLFVALVIVIGLAYCLTGCASKKVIMKNCVSANDLWYVCEKP